MQNRSHPTVLNESTIWHFDIVPRSTWQSIKHLFAATSEKKRQVGLRRKKYPTMSKNTADQESKTDIEKPFDVKLQ